MDLSYTPEDEAYRLKVREWFEGNRPGPLETHEQRRAWHRKLYEAGKPLDFKACMDISRTAYEELVEDAAKATALKVKRPLPPAGSGNFQPWNQLLMNAGVLTEDEGALSQKLYNFLSNVGAHRLGSALEHVRVAKAMVIELGMLVVGRVQSLTS